MDIGTEFLNQIILQLPNFVGLFFALMLVMRQNQKLTDALISMTERCDCRDKDERLAASIGGQNVSTNSG